MERMRTNQNASKSKRDKIFRRRVLGTIGVCIGSERNPCPKSKTPFQFLEEGFCYD